MVQLTCIDDTQRPVEIPPSKWVKVGSVYTPTFAIIVVPQNVLAVELLEIELTKSEAPYDYFQAARFTIPIDQYAEWWYFVHDCLRQNKMSNDAANALIKKVKHQVEFIEN